MSLPGPLMAELTRKERMKLPRQQMPAQAAVRRAHRLDPDNAEVYLALGRLAAFEGDGDAARRFWRKGLALDPYDARFADLLRPPPQLAR